MRHSWVEPISARPRLGTPTACLTSHAELNYLRLLPEHTIFLWGRWHYHTLLSQYSTKYQTYNKVVDTTEIHTEIPKRWWVTESEVKHIFEASVHVFTGNAGKGNPARNKFHGAQAPITSAEGFLSRCFTAEVELSLGVEILLAYEECYYVKRCSDPA